MKERLERQARNESLIRTVNEQSRSGRASDRLAAPEHQFEFQCECGENSGCDAVVLMTLDEYERIRSQRDRFAVVPGHENSEIERVVERDDGTSLSASSMRLNVSSSRSSDDAAVRSDVGVYEPRSVRRVRTRIPRERARWTARAHRRQSSGGLLPGVRQARILRQRQVND
jgi:hypothetical protein